MHAVDSIPSPSLRARLSGEGEESLPDSHRVHHATWRSVEMRLCAFIIKEHVNSSDLAHAH